MDNGLGLYPMVLGPKAADHEYADQYVKVTNSTFVGSTAGSSCDDDLDPNHKIMVTSEAGRGRKPGFKGKVGVVFIFECFYRLCLVVVVFLMG